MEENLLEKNICVYRKLTTTERLIHSVERIMRSVDRLMYSIGISIVDILMYIFIAIFIAIFIVACYISLFNLYLLPLNMLCIAGLYPVADIVLDKYTHDSRWVKYRNTHGAVIAVFFALFYSAMSLNFSFDSFMHWGIIVGIHTFVTTGVIVVWALLINKVYIYNHW